MARPTVSVLMNCLNGEKYLTEALDSVFAQTYQDFEVVFWDDASTDGSARIAKSYGRKLRYFRGLGDMPLGYSRNCGLEKARGEFLAILDCDDWWRTTHLAQLVASHNPFPASYQALLTASNPLLSSSLLFRTASVRLRGGWNPSLRYAEMYDLCLRLSHHHQPIWQSLDTAYIRTHAGQAFGSGHAAATKEVLKVMRPHHWHGGPRQVLREGLLWAKYGWQTVSA